MTDPYPEIPDLAMFEATRLVEFAKGSLHPELGFQSLDSWGGVDRRDPVETFITARMTFCFSIASLIGLDDVHRFAAHGVAGLMGALRDVADGGWFVSTSGTPDSFRKRAYDLCFVTLAASAAASAGIGRGNELLSLALAVMDDRFWSESDSALVESWDRHFEVAEPYWGANANMHGVESMLAAFGHTGELLWRDRAYRLAENFINRRARKTHWWLMEHYDDRWNVLPDYNSAHPRDEFRPYGMTIGHLFEWSRLLLELESTYDVPPAWIREAADGLYNLAVRYGWAVDGAAGFVYTVDWDGAPVVRQRPHWVLAEAISAAATWQRLTGGSDYGRQLETWSRYAETYLHDRERGSWHHELDPSNEPTTQMWRGKPDIYHALESVLIPNLPIAESLAVRVLKFGDS